MPRAKPKARSKKALEWRRHALRLHLVGCSFSQIAEMLGLDASTIRKGIDEELKDETADYAEDLKRDRAVKCAQLDTILRGNLTKASSGDVNSSFVCISAIKEQVRIKGLAAAEKVDVNAKLTLSFDAHEALLERIAKFVKPDEVHDPGSGEDAGGSPGGADSKS